MAYRAQQLLEHSLLSELRAIVARALSGLDMFAGNQLSELDLLGSDFMETLPQENVRRHISAELFSYLHICICLVCQPGEKAVCMQSGNVCTFAAVIPQNGTSPARTPQGSLQRSVVMVLPF